MKCPACNLFHYGACKNSKVPLSKRMNALMIVDGDRIPDYFTGPDAKEFVEEVREMERKLEKLQRTLGLPK